MSSETFIHRQRVIYAQCTIGNHVYHSRYLDIMEAARGEFMRALGYPLQRLQDEDYIFPVVSLRMKFIAPARYDDELEIRLSLKDVSRLRLTVNHQIAGSEGQTFVEAETDHVCTSIHEKPKRMPLELLAACERYLVKA
jgi:acyl-CoA thioester hydrolase